MDNIINKLRNLDAYPKINEDFYSRTLSGGVITLASSIFMLLLFISELSLYSLPRYAYILGFNDFIVWNLLDLELLFGYMGVWSLSGLVDLFQFENWCKHCS